MIDPWRDRRMGGMDAGMGGWGPESHRGGQLGKAPMVWGG